MNSICIRKHEKGRKEGFICLKHPVNGKKQIKTKQQKKCISLWKGMGYMNNPESTILVARFAVSTSSSEDVNSLCLSSAAFVWTQLKYCKVFKTSFVFYLDKRHFSQTHMFRNKFPFPAQSHMLLTALPTYVILFLDPSFFFFFVK